MHVDLEDGGASHAAATDLAATRMNYCVISYLVCIYEYALGGFGK